MKECLKCKVSKELEDFHRRSSAPDGRQNWCKSCNLTARKASYTKPGGRVVAKKYAKEWQEENRQRVWDYLSLHPCVDCDESDIIVLEFDHRDPTIKDRNISAMLGWSWQRIAAEIEKCDVRCANCHRRRTAIQLGWAKANLD